MSISRETTQSVTLDIALQESVLISEVVHTGKLLETIATAKADLEIPQVWGVLENTGHYTIVEQAENKSILESRENMAILENTENKTILESAEREALLENTDNKTIIENTENKATLENTKTKVTLEKSENKSSYY